MAGDRRQGPVRARSLQLPYRHIEQDDEVRVGDFGARAARACLESNGVAPDDVDIVINGSIAREYFEPGTAMEIAAKCGLERCQAFDVTSACAGQMEGLHIASAYLHMYPEVNHALVVSAELTRQFLAYDVQSPEELVHKVAGLTIGNAAAAWLVGREPYPGGCLEIEGMANLSLPGHWGLCQAPIDGTFTSFSHELFKLNVHVAPELKRLLGRIGWSADEVDHFVFHQPSDEIVVRVLKALGAGPDRAVLCHSDYGNTASTTVAVAMHETLKQREVKDGDKLLLCTAAAGFTVVSAAGTWVA